MKKIAFLFLLLFISIQAFAENGNTSGPSEPTKDDGPPLINKDALSGGENEGKPSGEKNEENPEKKKKDIGEKDKGKKPEELEKTIFKDNPGYFKSKGMVGIYGFLPDFHSKTFQDGNIGGGGFAYYNLANQFWGNVAVGVSSDYTFTKASRGNYTANMKLAPVTFNIAYMTASDTVNFWGGGGISYNFADTDIRDVTFNGNTVAANKKVMLNFWSADVFIGGEYIFTEKYKFGAFFEFRYTFTQPVHLNSDFGSLGSIHDTMTLQRFRYTVGFTYHF